MEDISIMLMIAIALGALHVALGLLLGLVDALGHRHYRHALGKFGWLALEVGGVAALATGGEMQTMSLALIGVAAVMIVIGEGIIGIIEIPGLLGNILSYARIAAVGLASVALALVLNMIKPDASMGVMLLIVVPIFVLGHLLNFILGIFEPFVQGARLHYVEFSTKFYEGGGTWFTPFSKHKVR